MINKTTLRLLRGIYLDAFFVFAFFFILSEIGVGMAQYCLFRFYGNAYQWMLHWYLPIPFHVKIGLDYIGFVIPLVTSVIIMLITRKSRMHLSRLSLVTLIAFLAVSIFLTHYVGALQYVNKEVGGGQNWATVAVVSVYLGYSLYKTSYSTVFWLSYPLGFITGLVSDVSAILRIYGNGIGVFGGAGFADADFLYPLVFLLSVTISAYIVRKIESKNRSLRNLHHPT
jgi:hypothetical protein